MILCEEIDLIVHVDNVVQLFVVVVVDSGVGGGCGGEGVLFVAAFLNFHLIFQIFSFFYF